MADTIPVTDEQVFRITIMLEMFPEKARVFETSYDPISNPNSCAKVVVQQMIVSWIGDEMVKCASADYRTYTPIWMNGIFKMLESTHNWNPQHPLIIHSGNGLITIEPITRS